MPFGSIALWDGRHGRVRLDALPGRKVSIAFRLNCPLGPATESSTAAFPTGLNCLSAQLPFGVTGESGPDHDKRFTMSVLLNGSDIGSGTGRSKKEAEQAAAKAALEKL